MQTMPKRLIGAAVAGLVFLVVMAGAWVWARATLGGDAVRASVAAQLSTALGRPVRIGSIGPTFVPRPSLTLRDVEIDPPGRIAIDRIDLSAALGALLSRRIEHASVRVASARVELPLPAFSMRGAEPSGSSQVELVSVDEILVSDLAIVAGNRTWTGQVDVVPEDSGLIIRSIELTGDGTSALVSGRLSDLSGPSGEVVVEAERLDLLEVAAVASAFGGSDERGPRETAWPSTGAASSGRSLVLQLRAEEATAGPVPVEQLRGEARLTDDALIVEPVTFGTLGGRGEGSAVVALGQPVPSYRLEALLEDVDVAQAAATAGRADTMTGRMAATISVAGQGATFEAARGTAVGIAQVEAVDGTIPGLGIIHTLSAFTSERGGLGGLAALLSGDAGAGASADSYSRIGLSLDIANDLARTDDFRFESSEVLITAAGTIALDGSAIDLEGQARLSNGMTAPARVTGTITAPQIGLTDGGAPGGNAIDLENIDVEGAIKSLLGGLGGSRGR